MTGNDNKKNINIFMFLNFLLMYFPELIFEYINVIIIGIILKCGFLFFLFIDMCFGMIDICHYSAGVYYSQTRN